MTEPQPSLNGDNGRGPDGRFAKGNPGGPGNPHAKKVHRLRSALLNAVKPQDVTEIIKKLVELSKAGDVAAMRLLFDRLLGPPICADLADKIEKLEFLLGDIPSELGTPSREA